MRSTNTVCAHARVHACTCARMHACTKVLAQYSWAHLPYIIRIMIYVFTGPLRISGLCVHTRSVIWSSVHWNRKIKKIVKSVGKQLCLCM